MKSSLLILIGLWSAIGIAAELDPVPLKEKLPNGREISLKEVRRFTEGVPVSGQDGQTRPFNFLSFHYTEIALSPDGSVLAMAQDNGVDLFDIATGTRVRSLTFPTLATLAEERAIAFSPNGRYLAFGLNGREGTGSPLTREIAIWDLATGQQHPKSISQENAPPFNWPLYFSPEGECLFFVQKTPYADLKDWLWRIEIKGGGQCPHSPVFEANKIETTALSTDGRMLAASSGGKVAWYDLSRQKRLGEITDLQDGPVGGPRNVLFSPDGKKLVVTVDRVSQYRWPKSSELLIWDLASKTLVGNIYGPSSVHWDLSSIVPVGFSRDGDLLFSVEQVEGRSDWKIWNMENRQEVLKGNKTTENAKIGFSTRSNRIATISVEPTPRPARMANDSYPGNDRRVLRIFEVVQSDPPSH